MLGSSALGKKVKERPNSERVYHEANPFRVENEISMMIPGLSLALEPRAKTSQRLRRYVLECKQTHYHFAVVS
jgi:hypothetical protein